MGGYDIQTILGAIVFFLPAYVANMSAGFFGGGRPLDFGKTTWDKRRILGNGKTIRGSLGGTISGILYKVGENLYHLRSPANGLFLAFLLSFGAIFGDIVGSFIKRRLGVESGESAPLLDQLDFVIGALFFAGIIVEITVETTIILLIVSPIGHLSVNILGFLLHRKEVPW